MKFLKTKMLTLMLLLTPIAAFAGFQAFNSSNSNLGVFPVIKCSTGITCTRSGNQLLMTSSPSAAASIDITAANAGDAPLTLKADNSDDSGDDWLMQAVASGNALTFSNDTSGSQVIKLSMSTAGVLSLSDGETISNAVADDTVRVASNDAALIFDLYSPLTSDGDASLRLSADASADNGDDWLIQHDGATNDLLFQNDVSGSQASKMVLSDAGELSGFRRLQVASTTASVTVAQCGVSFVSNSADVMGLPEASTALGCRVTFICGTADNLDVNPADGTDQIGPVSVDGAAIAPDAGDAIRCTDIGSSFTLEAIGVDLWAVVAHNGAITDVN